VTISSRPPAPCHLCGENRIEGIEKFGRTWMIPKGADKPKDVELKRRNEITASKIKQ